MTAAKQFRLSKSQYCKAQKCMKALWLYRHRKDLADEVSDFQQQIFDQGTSVGELAQQLYPGGVLISEDYTQPEEAIKSTAKVLKQNPPAIFEAAFIHENVLIRVDILVNNQDGTWDFNEVKSTTSVKENAHYDDVAIQKWVLTNNKIKIRKSSVMFLNSDYIRNGPLDLHQLFKTEAIDNEIAPLLKDIPKLLKNAQAHLSQAKPPQIEIGSQCSTPYPCEFMGHCWSHIGEGHVYSLGRVGAKAEKLLNKGIEQIKDVPEKLAKDLKFTANQIVEWNSYRNQDPHIDLKAIQNHLKELKYPLYFLDYETASYAVPMFDGTWPYKQLVTQYSLHIQRAPGGELEHKWFLHNENTDPSKLVAESLVRDIADDGGSVIVYHQSFEKGRTTELAGDVPDCAARLMDIVDRMWDLEVPFAKRWYWDRKFEGSSSIKAVLPVFKPELSYDDLEIQAGGTASVEFSRMVRMDVGDPERERIFENLLRYCERDSWAMVVILDLLITVVRR